MNSGESPTTSNSDQDLEEIKIVEFSSEVYTDQRRIKVNFTLSPFLENPNASIKLINQDNNLLTEVNIVNIFSSANEITLHIPANRNKPGDYRIELDLFYIREEEPQDADEQAALKTIPIKSVSTTFSLL